MLFPGLKALDEEVGTRSFQSRGAMKHHTGEDFCAPYGNGDWPQLWSRQRIPSRHGWRTCQHSFDQQPKRGKYFGKLCIPGRFNLISEFLLKYIKGDNTSGEMNDNTTHSSHTTSPDLAFIERMTNPWWSVQQFPESNDVKSDHPQIPGDPLQLAALQPTQRKEYFRVFRLMLMGKILLHRTFNWKFGKSSLPS